MPAGHHVAVLPLPLLSCLLLPLLVTRRDAAFLFLILPSAGKGFESDDCNTMDMDLYVE